MKQSKLSKIYTYLVFIFFILSNVSCQNDYRETHYSDGSLKSRECFKNGQLNGKSIKFYRNGKIKQEDNFLDGLKSGKSKYYDKCGKIRLIEEYEFGKESGVSTHFYSSGNIDIKFKMLNDSLLGYIQYDSLGNIIEEYYKVQLLNALDTVCTGDSYCATITVDGFLESKRIKIVSVLFGVDTVSNPTTNNQKVDYCSPIICSTGYYIFQANVFVDTTVYILKKKIVALPAP